jgi:CubicO group peptidase (beta-lactamase class C family)
MLRRSSLLLVAAVAFAQPPDLDSVVAEAMREYEIPGIAIAIVKDGKPVLLKGYGVRKLAGGAAVDERTLFGIASNTKAFTTAALAILVDEKKLAWDDRVTKYLPGFAMADPYVTRELTVRDLVTHRSGLGLGAGDLMFWPDTTFTREKVVSGVRHLAPANSFRSRYAYNNTLYVVAGEVVAAVSGMSYDEFLKRRVLGPLGMNEARVGNRGVSETMNAAVPHSRGWRYAGPVKPVVWTQDEVWAAAAGIKCGVADLTKWLQVQLNQGKLPNGEALYSEARAREMWSAQTVVGVGREPEEVRASQAEFSAYGLGWFLKDYRGRKVVTHTGGLTGMVSVTAMVPSLNLGFAVLTNQEEGGAIRALMNHILDHYMGVPREPWVSKFMAVTLRNRAEDNDGEAKDRESRRQGTAPSLPLEELAGIYKDAWYGQMRVTKTDSALRIEMVPTPAMRGKLEHWQYNTFVARWDDPTIPDAYVTFFVGDKAAVTEVRLRAVSAIADFSFDFHDLRFLPELADGPAKR